MVDRVAAVKSGIFRQPKLGGRMATLRRWCLVGLALLCCLPAGCRGGMQLTTARNQFYHGAFDDSQATLEKIKESDRKASVVSTLDLAMVHLAAGETDAAEQLLLEARGTLDENQAADPVAGTISYITDDTARQYRGWGYEQVMIRAMLALTSMMSDAVDAEAYALQAQSKQMELQQAAIDAGMLDADKHYQPLAFAPYVRGVLREMNYRDYDDASRAYRLVSEIQPSFAPAEIDIARAESGVHCQPGHGVVYIFALVGQGPQRVAQQAPVTSNVLLLADRVVSAVGKYSVPPTMAPIEIPAVAIPETAIDTVFVMADDQPLGLTQSITDVGQMAVQQYEAEKTDLLVRAVARRIVKKSAVAAGKDAFGIQDPMLQLVVDLAGSAWEATEKTDTRCWSLLPREIQVLRAELPVGTHNISLQAFGRGSPLQRDPTARTIEVEDGRNTYVLATAPSDRVIAAAAR
ncbi:hypothetical protein Mal33_19550 [Rosistilla oblonga]|uniref:Uncharacterized protein n=1 Tax=Rosistilla oblonga TaxID=2527990 RepID=A0A518IS97_9BACT|nr:hypothetical protein Mal33_19550 [Rosistilla oblonga]